MQRTFITVMPEVIEDHQVVVELPRYEVPLTKAFIRRDVNNYGRFLVDNETLNVMTTLNQIKMFVDELSMLDKEINQNVRVPFTNYVGLPFDRSGDAVKWARAFVRRFFPETEERLLKKTLLNIPFNKSEIIWLGDEKYLPFVQRIAISPSTDDLVVSVETKPRAPLTREEASKLRAEIAAKKGKKE